MRIFIASSGERLNMAIEVGSWLEGMNVEPVLWNEPEVFPLGAYTWDALIDLSENVDAAIFIFGEDDQIWFRGESTMTVPGRKPKVRKMTGYFTFTKVRMRSRGLYGEFFLRRFR